MKEQVRRHASLCLSMLLPQVAFLTTVIFVQVNNTQQVSKLNGTTMQREVKKVPILSWWLPFCKHNAKPGQDYPLLPLSTSSLQTISPVWRAPGYIYFPNNACPTQTETRNGSEHSLGYFPACHQQKQMKPFKIGEGQHRDRNRKGRIKSLKFFQQTL